MIEELGADSLINDVIFSSEGTKIVLVVEGEFEVLLFEQRLDLSEASVVNAHGKPNILEAINELVTLNESLIVLMDRDFDDASQFIADDRVIYTSDYNLEATVLLHRETFATLWKTHILPVRPNHSMDEALACCSGVAKSIGEVRYLNHVHAHGLRFENSPLLDACSADECFSLDLVIFLTKLIERSARSPLALRYRHSPTRPDATQQAVKLIEKQMRALRKSRALDNVNLISGHDVSSALNVLMSRCLKGGYPGARMIELQAAALFQVSGLGLQPFVDIDECATRQGFSVIWRTDEAA